MGWARWARASLGAYALAALSWRFRPSKMPWDPLLVASVRVMLRSQGIPAGSLVIDDTDNPRSTSATALADLSTLRAQESGGYRWGQSLLFLVLVTPPISRPVGFGFSRPAPERRAWDTQAKGRKKPGVPPQQRPPTPAPHAPSPPKQHRARRLLEAFQAHHPAIRGHGIAADAR